MARSESLASKLLALGELSQLTSVQMPRQRLLALFGAKLHTLFGASALAVWNFDSANKMLTLVYGHDLSPEVNNCCLQPVSVGLFPDVALAIEGGNVWTTEDLADTPLFTDPKTRALYTSMGVQAILASPLRALTHVRGALSFYYRQTRGFTEEDKALALAFANSLSLSISNIDAYERLVVLEGVKSEVIDIVAHQFRTPIATLRGNVELLKDESVSGSAETRSQIIRELEKVGEKLLKFVENFLNVKAIDEGRLEPRREPLDPNVLVEKVIADLDTYRGQHKVEIALQKLSGTPLISVDPSLVGEAFLNVLGNAIKYAKQRVQVTLRSEGSDVVIVVQDDGPGIPSAEQPMIFQKLFRASNVVRHPEASSGLGLYIAKQYAERNGGRIWFTSVEGKGSTFFLAFPRA